MSGVLLVTPIVAAIFGWIIGLIVSWIAKRFRARRANDIATGVGIAAAIASFVPLFGAIAWLSTTTLIDLDPREGERRLAHYGLPANTTSDFCYRISSLGIALLADFQMSETDFLAWMAARKWKAVPFDLGDDEWSIRVDGGAVTLADPEVYPVRQFASHTSLRVKRGYCYYWAMPDTPDNTTKIIFDSDTNRTYVEHTTY